MPRPIRLCLALLPVAASFLAAAASAQGVLVLDQPPVVPIGGGLSADSGCDRNTAGLFTENAARAENFTLASPHRLQEMSVWGTYQDNVSQSGNSTPPATDRFTVVFHQDAAGLPGAVIATPTSLVDVAAARVFETNLNQIMLYRFDIPLGNIDLPAGTYWVEVFANTIAAPAPGCFFWRQGTRDAAHSPVTIASSLQTPGSTWTGSSSFDLSTRIGAIPIELPSEVPTLGAGALAALAAGLAALALRRLR